MSRSRIVLAVLAAVTLVAGPAEALTVIHTASVDPEPALIAVNPLTKKVYVAGTGWMSGPGTPGNAVTVIDASLSPPAVIGSVPVGVYPYGIDVNIVTDKIYVANYGSGTVSVLDEATAPPTVTTIAGIPFPAGVAVNPVTNRIYVVSASTGSLFVINGSTDTISAVLPISAPSTAPLLVEVNPILNRIYVPQWHGGLLHVFDGLQNTHVAVVPLPDVGFGTDLGGVAIHPVTQDVYVTGEKGGIYRLDGLTHALEGTSPVGPPGVLHFGTWGVEVNALKGHVYVAQFHTNSVHVLDASTLAPLGMVLTGPPSTGPTSGPHFTALDPLSGRLFVTNELFSTVSVITDP